ncbi:MAG: metal ABC transporter permease, partial [Bacteroidota bacterium]
MDMLHTLYADYTVRIIAGGTLILGMLSGLLGVFAVLRKQSLLGDAVAHASLPGIALAFLISGMKSQLWLLSGAAIAGWIASLWITGIIKNTRIKSDSALAMVLAVFFGIGLVLLTYIQKIPDANQAGLETFLFGQAATLVRRDVINMAVISAMVLVVLLLFWKEFKLITFDPQFARSAGFRVKFLDILLNTLIVVAIVLGLQAVGVILMSALLIAPAAAARQWTNRLGTMAVLAAVFGAMAGLTGTVVSASGSNISTGPVIVLSAIGLVAISFVFAPGRGLLAVYLLRLKSRSGIMHTRVLARMYQVSM